MSQFADDIQTFNQMYKFPTPQSPTVINSQRLIDLKDILGDENAEIDDIIEKLKQAEAQAEAAGLPAIPREAALEVLTMLADLLGDIQVYCASEMAKWGLPLDETLSIIMQSNFSKLDENGQPIYDNRGKLLKGPGYWKPEPKLSKMLEARLAASENKLDYVYVTGVIGQAAFDSSLHVSLRNSELLRVTPSGERIWHPDIDAILADDSFWAFSTDKPVRLILLDLRQLYLTEQA